MSILNTCLRRESNPHSRCGEQDFKSCVSTSSTTKAVQKKIHQNDGILLSGRPGSNRPPRPWQGRALPNELLPLITVIAYLRTLFLFWDCKDKVLNLTAKSFFVFYLYSGLNLLLDCTSTSGVPL